MGKFVRTFSIVLAASVGLVEFLGCKGRTASSNLLSSAAGTAPTQIRMITGWTCPASGPIRVAFFDADSTLRVSKVYGNVSANAADDVLVLPLVAPKLAKLASEGYLIAIVSNQMGVSAGHVLPEVASGALLYAAQQIAKLGGSVHHVDMAESNDSFRKPNTGMATRLDQAIQTQCDGKGMSVPDSFMVGDSGYMMPQPGKPGDGPHPDGRPADDFSNADRMFAKKLFAPSAELTAKNFQEPTDFFGWKRFGVFNIGNIWDLDDFLITLEGEVHQLRFEGKPEEAERLAQEVTALRQPLAAPRAWRFVHYNIKEFTTGKVTNSNDKQTKVAYANLRRLAPDILSINELQYDQPNIPTAGLPGTGENMSRIVKATQPNGESWDVTFQPGNTGKLAKPLPDGSYMIDPNGQGSKDVADLANFGTIPGQYSTGFASRLKVSDRVINADLKWNDWDDTISFADWKLLDGKPVPPTLELFDKNFNDTTVDLDGRPAHFITFHTVPAFDFGGGTGLNVSRNKSQLEFLEWYLTGTCDPSAANSRVRRCEAGLKPLPEDAAFIAVGDFNVDYAAPAPGAAVLARLFGNSRVQKFFPENRDPLMNKEGQTGKSFVSFLQDGVDLGKLQSHLDYFVVSKEFQIQGGRVVAPLSQYVEHGCKEQMAAATALKATIGQLEGRDLSISTRYLDANRRQYCVVSVAKEFTEFRKGSDHFPVYMNFRWKVAASPASAVSHAP